MRSLFASLKFKLNPNKHWIHYACWQMVEAMHEVILKSTLLVV